jgi:hypothetical protein
MENRESRSNYRKARQRESSTTVIDKAQIHTARNRPFHEQGRCIVLGLGDFLVEVKAVAGGSEE